MDQRRHWPTTAILLRADSHYGTPEVLDLCDSLGLRYVFGLSKNPRLREQVQALEASTADRYVRICANEKRGRRPVPRHNPIST